MVLQLQTRWGCPLKYRSGRSTSHPVAVEPFVGSQAVELKHVPRWQLALATKPAGLAIRALARLGPEKADEALPSIKRKLSAEAFGKLVAPAPQFPSWLARSVGKAAYG